MSLSGYNRDLRKVEYTFEGEESHQVQHAYDHLKGKMIHEIEKNNGDLYFKEQFQDLLPQSFELVMSLKKV